MKSNEIKKIKKLVNEEMKSFFEQDAAEQMEKAEYQSYQDFYLTPQSNWRVKQNVPMLSAKGAVYSGKLGEIHKIQTVEYDLMHHGEVVTECGGETYSIDSDDFRKAFEMVNDEEGLQTNNESVRDRTSPSPRDMGVLIVTNNEKYVINTHVTPFQEVPLKVGMDITNFIRDYNVYSANETIKYENKENEWKVIAVPYDYNTNRKYTGKKIETNNESVNDDYAVIKLRNKIKQKISFTFPESTKIENGILLGTLNRYEKNFAIIKFSGKKIFVPIGNVVEYEGGKINESVIKEEVKKLVKIKDYFGKNIKESIEKLEEVFLNESTMNIYDSSIDHGKRTVSLIFDGRFNIKIVNDYMRKNYSTENFEVTDYSNPTTYKGFENPGVVDVQIQYYDNENPNEPEDAYLDQSFEDSISGDGYEIDENTHNAQYVIKNIDGGNKRYLHAYFNGIKIQPNNFFQSKNPFNDNSILKFNDNNILNVLKSINLPGGKIFVVDNTGQQFNKDYFIDNYDRIKFMIKNGLGDDDMKNDITYPHEI